MPIETIDLSDPKFVNYIRGFKQQDWTLCIGAGICKGILPDWIDLTHKLVNRCFKKNLTWDEFKKATETVGFSLDSWIQGCANKIVSEGGTIEEFDKILEEVLYEPLLIKARAENVEKDLIKVFESPKELSKKSLYNVCDFFEKHYSDKTLMQIVRALLYDDENLKKPSAIVTFNADSLLHSLLEIFNIKIQSEKTGNYHYPKERFKKVTRTYQQWGDSTPIFHLHGSLSPMGDESSVKGSDARDSLVFLESSYSNVAANMYSWSQTNFLYLAQTSKMVFLGLSMSDPNIRKWMIWTNERYTQELSQLRQEKTISLNHLWIKTKEEVNIQEFLDVSLRHLGVKIGLIQSWDEVESTLLKIM